MSGTYKAIGINLKSTPFGESDRLLTILTEDTGFVRAVAPGSRKHKSSLGGRSGLFVINELLIANGKSLDKVVQAESIESFPGLSQDLRKLTAAQYLAEIALCQAFTDQPQAELYHLLREHLSRVEQLPGSVTLPCLVHAIFHLLALAGVSPQVHGCCVSQQPIVPDFADPNWRVGFSVVAGGTVLLSDLENLQLDGLPSNSPTKQLPAKKLSVGLSSLPSKAQAANRAIVRTKSPPELQTQLTAIELYLLQQLTQPNLIETLTTADPPVFASNQVWLPIERVLRHYAQYYFDRPIRSAALIDTCFAPADAPSFPRDHDAIV